MCLVDFSDENFVDTPSAEDFGRTDTVPGYVGATHVWLFLRL